MIDREEESVESLEVKMLMDLFSFIRVPNDLARDDKRDRCFMVMFCSHQHRKYRRCERFLFLLSRVRVGIMRFVPARSRCHRHSFNTRTRKRQKERQTTAVGSFIQTRLLILFLSLSLRVRNSKHTSNSNGPSAS